MSAPRNIPDLSHNDPTAVALRKILTIRQEEIAANRDFFLSERSIEKSRKSVHDLRISLRREQAFLNVFHDYLPKKKATNARKYVRKSLRALGPIREQDVFVTLLHQYALTLAGEHRASLFLLAGRIQHQRETDVKALRTDIRSILGKGWEEETGVLMGTLEKWQSEGDRPESTGVFGPTSAEILSLQLNHLISAGDNAIRKSDGTGLHDVRVDAKPIRYILEGLNQLYPKLEGYYGEIKHFVGLLGELHDGELLVPLLERHKGEITQYGRFMKTHEGVVISTEGLRAMGEDIVTRRTELVGETRRILRRWKRDAVPGKIASMIRA